jgi:hypothetical protein
VYVYAEKKVMKFCVKPDNAGRLLRTLGDILMSSRIRSNLVIEVFTQCRSLMTHAYSEVTGHKSR